MAAAPQFWSSVPKVQAQHQHWGLQQCRKCTLLHSCDTRAGGSSLVSVPKPGPSLSNWMLFCAVSVRGKPTFSVLGFSSELLIQIRHPLSEVFGTNILDIGFFFGILEYLHISNPVHKVKHSPQAPANAHGPPLGQTFIYLRTVRWRHRLECSEIESRGVASAQHGQGPPLLWPPTCSNASKPVWVGFTGRTPGREGEEWVREGELGAWQGADLVTILHAGSCPL